METTRAVDSWFFMSNFWTPLALTSAYLFFVVVGGPWLMKDRKPMKLKPVMLVYNLAQVIFSSWAVIKGIRESYGVFWEASCRPSIMDPVAAYELDSLGWYYMMSKFIEFLDTIFFILRGKWNQVTFLHVFHHASMAMYTWFCIKHLRGIQLLMIGVSNCFVHAAMYGYYLLASFGPGMRKYLWWKKYITKLQIMQFIAIISFMLYLHWQQCDTPTNFIIFSISNTSFFLVLFLLFYNKAYKKKNV